MTVGEIRNCLFQIFIILVFSGSAKSSKVFSEKQWPPLELPPPPLKGIALFALIHLINPPLPPPPLISNGCLWDWILMQHSWAKYHAVDINMAKGGVCGSAVYFVLPNGDFQQREWTFRCSVKG
jgi:hypothetical protein